MTRLHKLLYALSMTDRNILSKCHHRSFLFREVAGISIILTGIIAFISGYFFISTVADSFLICLGAAILWSLIVINIDRMIYTSAKWYVYVVRFFVAVAISVIVAFPLELKLLDGEIEQAITEKNNSNLEAQQKLINQVDGQYSDKISNLESRLHEADGKVIEFRRLRGSEDAGIVLDESSSGRRGKGVKYRYYNDQVDAWQSQAQLLTAELDSARKEYKFRLNKQEAFNKQTSFKESTGFLARFTALEQVKNETDDYGVLTIRAQSTRTISWALRIIIALIELAPALLKMMMGRCDYDEAIDGFMRVTKDRVFIIANSVSDQAIQNPTQNPKPSFMTRMKEFLDINK